MKPPYDITSTILTLISSIAERSGAMSITHVMGLNEKQKEEAKVQNIHASLSIEGSPLTIRQVTSIVSGEQLPLPDREVREILNADKAYDLMTTFLPFSVEHLKKAHGIMMKGLIPTAGRFRTGGVAIVKGEDLAHLPPPHHQVAALMSDLLHYLEHDKDIMLIKACVFHYELEFIHPFADGNGRIGRLWQTLALCRHSKLFEFLLVERLIAQHRKEYYRVLGECDKVGRSTAFIEFMLDLIDQALGRLSMISAPRPKVGDRLITFLDVWGSDTFDRKEYLQFFKYISTATASRDLANGVAKGRIKKLGKGNQSRYAPSPSNSPKV